MTNISDIVRLQKSNSFKLKVAIFDDLRGEDEDYIINNYRYIAKKTVLHINDLIGNAHELADKHSLRENHLPEDKLRKLLIEGAALALIAKIAAAVHNNISVRDAVRQVNTSIERISTTETFVAYNKKFVINHKEMGGTYIWNAILDERTCEICELLDETQYKSNDDVPDLPHIRCRCIIEFRPE